MRRIAGDRRFPPHSDVKPRDKPLPIGRRAAAASCADPWPPRTNPVRVLPPRRSSSKSRTAVPRLIAASLTATGVRFACVVGVCTATTASSLSSLRPRRPPPHLRPQRWPHPHRLPVHGRAPSPRSKPITSPRSAGRSPAATPSTPGPLRLHRVQAGRRAGRRRHLSQGGREGGVRPRIPQPPSSFKQVQRRVDNRSYTSQPVASANV
jgi:hypothetical protein